MSAQMQCDAPDCTRTRPLTAPFSSWVTVKAPFKSVRHFHSLLCAAAWALSQEAAAVDKKRAAAEQKVTTS